jgi:hypothetical protein
MRIEKEIEIVYELAQNVLKYETTLVEASDICGDIDRCGMDTTCSKLDLMNSKAFWHLHGEQVCIS